MRVSVGDGRSYGANVLIEILPGNINIIIYYKLTAGHSDVFIMLTAENTSAWASLTLTNTKGR